MVVSRRFANAERAEQYRLRARTSSGDEKQRFLHLAELYIHEDELIAGSRRAIDESWQLLVELKYVKS